MIMGVSSKSLAFTLSLSILQSITKHRLYWTIILVFTLILKQWVIHLLQSIRIFFVMKPLSLTLRS